MAKVDHGADLFIAECYFYEGPFKWHPNYPDITAQRRNFGATRLGLTHRSREMLGRPSNFPEECAHDGLVITLEREPDYTKIAASRSREGASALRPAGSRSESGASRLISVRSCARMRWSAPEMGTKWAQSNVREIFADR